jgi:hypothetical protein
MTPDLVDGLPAALSRHAAMILSRCAVGAASGGAGPARGLVHRV